MKRQTNPYLGRVASLTGICDISRALETLVSSHRSGGESLESLARKLGVNRIAEERLPFDGGLFRLRDGELVIKRNVDSSFVRKRFTLAHEIAHLLLDTVPAHRNGSHADEDLERACDLIAAELLMPTTETSNFVRGLGSPSPDSLKAIASRYAVSLQTVAIRLYSGLKLWKCAIGMWTVFPKTKTLWFVGPKRWDMVQPDDSLLERAVSSCTSFKAKDLWRRGETTEPVWLNLLGVGSSKVSCISSTRFGG